MEDGRWKMHVAWWHVLQALTEMDHFVIFCWIPHMALPVLLPVVQVVPVVRFDHTAHGTQMLGGPLTGTKIKLRVVVPVTSLRLSHKAAGKQVMIPDQISYRSIY